MKISLSPLQREQSRAEEIANSISHGIGLVAALVASPLLILHAVRRGDPGFIVGASIFAATMVLLYLASTLYHALPIGRAKRVFRVIEHSAIFLLIAGTYTPFTLGVLRGPWGWTLLGLVWALAAAGLALKVFGRMSHPILSTSLYLLMGWLILIAVNPLSARVPVRPIMVNRRRRGLYGRRGFFRGRFASALWAFHLAFVCHGGYCMPLLRSVLVCGLK